MASIIRNVRDIDPADREALEHVVGQPLGANQQLIIEVVNVDAASPADLQGQGESSSALPEWCNVYEGLTDAEIEKSIVRSPGSRTFD